MTTARPGMIGFSNNKVGFIPKLIRFFTDSNISHTFIVTESIAQESAVQEADIQVQIASFIKHYVVDQDQQYWLYEIDSQYASREQIQEALRKVFIEFLNVKYGKFQLLWFPWRWFCEKVLRRDIRKSKNWMTDGVICSELVYWFLWYLGPVFQDLLKDLNPDTIQPEDIRRIVLANLHIFRLKEYKTDKNVVQVA